MANVLPPFTVAEMSAPVSAITVIVRVCVIAVPLNAAVTTRAVPAVVPVSVARYVESPALNEVAPMVMPLVPVPSENVTVCPLPILLLCASRSVTAARLVAFTTTVSGVSVIVLVTLDTAPARTRTGRLVDVRPVALNCSRPVPIVALSRRAGNVIVPSAPVLNGPPPASVAPTHAAPPAVTAVTVIGTPACATAPPLAFRNETVTPFSNAPLCTSRPPAVVSPGSVVMRIAVAGVGGGGEPAITVSGRVAVSTTPLIVVMTVVVVPAVTPVMLARYDESPALYVTVPTVAALVPPLRATVTV